MSLSFDQRRKNVPRPSATVRNVRANSPRLRRLLLAVSGLVALAAAACSGGGEGDESIRISSVDAASSTALATTTPTPTPTPTPLPVPAKPENAFAGGRLVEAYLAEGEPDIEGCLPEVVTEWGMAPEVDGVRCASLDLDGDRKDEFVFLISYGAGADDTSPYEADLWFFEDEDAGYRFFNSARALANGITSALRIRSVEDLTSDGLPDVVLTWDECGASTCLTHVTIASNHNGTLEDLAPEDASLESVEEFTMEGGAISLRGGKVSSAGAGPQRELTKTVTWAGSHFRTETVEGAPTHLIHLVNDADRLFAAGQYEDARLAYLAVVNDTALADWKAEIGEAPGRPELQAYSTFRAGLSAYRQGDLLDAGQLLERTATSYAPTMHGRAALEYLVSLSGGSPPELACTAAERYLDTVAEQYNAFWNYGTENPQRTVTTLCR